MLCLYDVVQMRVSIVITFVGSRLIRHCQLPYQPAAGERAAHLRAGGWGWRAGRISTMVNSLACRPSALCQLCLRSEQLLAGRSPHPTAASCQMRVRGGAAGGRHPALSCARQRCAAPLLSDRFGAHTRADISLPLLSAQVFSTPRTRVARQPRLLSPGVGPLPFCERERLHVGEWQVTDLRPWCRSYIRGGGRLVSPLLGQYCCAGGLVKAQLPPRRPFPTALGLKLNGDRISRTDGCGRG